VKKFSILFDARCNHEVYIIICSGDVKAYCAYVYMLYPLQGGQSTDLLARNTARYAAVSQEHITKYL